MKYVQQVCLSITSLTVTELTTSSHEVTGYVISAGASSNAFVIRFLFKFWPVAICSAWGFPRLPEPLPPLKAEIVNEWDSLKHVCNTVYGNCLVVFSFLFIIYPDVLTSGTGSEDPLDLMWWQRQKTWLLPEIGSRSPIPLLSYYTKSSWLLIVLTLTITGGSLVFRDSQNRWRRKLMAIFPRPFMTW